MNHDALIIPLNDTEELVVASDNSGSIGKKPFDEISVPYDIVGYSVFRVAYMECAAAGGVPFSIIMHNFNGDDVWGSLINGIRRGFTELGIQEAADYREYRIQLYIKTIGNKYDDFRKKTTKRSGSALQSSLSCSDHRKTPRR